MILRVHHPKQECFEIKAWTNTLVYSIFCWNLLD